jgi:ribose-phosphate pyrophosphokinase
MSTGSIKIFTGTESKYLAEKIAENAGIELGKSSCPRFSDGEFEPCYEETIRGSFTFIIQSTFPPADNLLELLLMIDAAKRASAYKIIAVMPYFGFARQGFYRGQAGCRYVINCGDRQVDYHGPSC